MTKEEYNVVYKRSKSGVLHRIYDQQKASSINRKHPMPTYTVIELKDWLFNQPLFHELHDQWIKSGYESDSKPSIDRLDDYKGYSFDNIRLTTWRVNRLKGNSDALLGINNKGNIAVIQLTKEGEFIKEFYSISKAHRVTKTNIAHICACCKGKRRSAGGYKWKYKQLNK